MEQPPPAETPKPDRTVQFYFDPTCPYDWLASLELERLQMAGVVVDCRPVWYAGLLRATGNKPATDNPAKLVYIFNDLFRLASQRGIKLVGPPKHPFDPMPSLRMCISVGRLEERLLFTREMFTACWEQGADLTDQNTLDAIAFRCGLDPASLRAAALDAQSKAKVEEATETAAREGIFGVPTFRHGQELFWGCDRVDSLLWAIDHPEHQDEMLQALLAWGAKAQRK